MRRPLVSEKRRYQVRTTDEAKLVARALLDGWGLDGEVAFGLPEVDDRYHLWRVPLVRGDGRRLGEVAIEAHTGRVQQGRSTRADLVRARLEDPEAEPARRDDGAGPQRSPLADAILHGDSEGLLAGLPAGSVDLAFTSPPYYNARPDYTDYVDYEDYLATMGRVFAAVRRVLAQGRFFVVNVAPVLLRRASRREASRRIAVPFDMHRVLVDAGFDFVDDIVWEKPEGAGWATGRGRRFAADRAPLQYKPVPVTEYLLVYRAGSDRLIDWHIRRHHDPEAVERSRIRGAYERTNVWRLPPASSPLHPAVFPVELAERVIRYWSFEGDVVLDPFAGIGTVGQAAAALGRRYVLCEREERYVAVMRDAAARWGQPPP
jgi:DNA modification methylase